LSPLFFFCLVFLCLMARPSPISTLFPYTTLFRSVDAFIGDEVVVEGEHGDYRHSELSTRRRQTHELAGVGAEQVELGDDGVVVRSEEHTSELQSRFDLVCRLLLEKKKIIDSRVRP